MLGARPAFAGASTAACTRSSSASVTPSSPAHPAILTLPVMASGTAAGPDLADILRPVRAKTLDYYVVAIFVVLPLWSIIGCAHPQLCCTPARIC
jgi:hypothetical protein